MTELNASAISTSQAKATLSGRIYFARTYLQAAALFAREAHAIETMSDENRRRELYPEYKSKVIAAVVMTASSLEAFINEVFVDASERHLTRLTGLDAGAVDRLGRMWTGLAQLAKSGVREKFDAALTLAEKPAIVYGAHPGQSVLVLLELRNVLLHYKPQTIKYERQIDYNEQITRLVARLKYKFSDSPFYGANEPIFPDRCLGHGCAAWAVSSTRDFINDFSSKLGIEPLPESLILETVNVK